MAHAAVVEVYQMVHAFHLVVLLFVVEPSRTDRHIALCGHPLVAIGVAILQLPVFLITRIHLVFPQESPVGGTGVAVFVAHPSASGASVGEDDGLWLVLVDSLPCPGIVIVGAAVDSTRLAGTTVVAVSTVGTVEPYLEDVAILCQEFVELCMEILTVQRCAVKSLMAVPGRQVDTEFESVFLAGCRQFTHDIALAVLVGSIAYAVVGVFGRPEAETVVVLGRDDDALHAGISQCLGPLLAVKPRRVETLERCIAVSPLPVAESVGTEMDKRIGLHLLPRHLVLGG